MSKEAGQFDPEGRLIDFALRIIRTAESLPKSKVGNYIAGQLFLNKNFVIRHFLFDIRYSFFNSQVSGCVNHYRRAGAGGRHRRLRIRA